MAQFRQEFTPLDRDAVHQDAARRKEEGWRYVQTLAVNAEDGVDLIYTYMKDGLLENLVVPLVPHGSSMPSITDVYLAAFVFENEIHDLFGITFTDLAIDFGGNFYRVAVSEPMTVISPEQKAAREKARRVAAAKAEKDAKAARAADAQTGYLADHPDAAGESKPGRVFDTASEADVEAKLAGMDPEKVARVRAAIAAKAKKAAAAEAAERDAELEAKLAAMDPEKAAKVRAAMEAKAKKAAEAAAKEGE
ncbi:MAG: NADH-quinone oxidoreductase subunit C [Eggerthellaceae bacterium]|nr:NADH-quinone oxidoreductase subunit C [Eggerthellaceae bacterium]